MNIEHAQIHPKFEIKKILDVLHSSSNIVHVFVPLNSKTHICVNFHGTMLFISLILQCHPTGSLVPSFNCQLVLQTQTDTSYIILNK